MIYCDSCIFIMVIAWISAGLLAHYTKTISGEEDENIVPEDVEEYGEETVNKNEMM